MTAPFPERRSIPRAQVRQALALLGLGDDRVTELHMNRDGGHALVFRQAEGGGLVVDNDFAVVAVDTVMIDVTDEPEPGR
ncbi:hypothetical protein [Nocardia asteroides]|uniref:hypothetical protein n=1 Tax=Nocardia asteroides TaxID=1824 RepID=UPI0033C4A1AC